MSLFDCSSSYIAQYSYNDTHNNNTIILKCLQTAAMSLTGIVTAAILRSLDTSVNNYKTII